jgi:hypothetical protein
MADVVTVLPGNLQGWMLTDQRNSGNAVINGTHPQSGNGSLYFTSTSGSDKADFTYSAGGASLGNLADLTNISYDVYRESGSTSAGHLAPSMRIIFATSAGINYLVWEPTYNGVSTVPTDVWTSFNATSGNWWLRQPGFTVEEYNHSLAYWLADARVGNVAILGINTGVGSGWNGTYGGAVDNVRLAIGSSDTTWNFEASAASAVPEPGETITLLSGGLGLLFAAARLRRKK